MVSLDDLFGHEYIDEIRSMPEGIVKVAYLAADPFLQVVLDCNEFNGSHVSQIVRNDEWKEKLEWIKGNYETILESLGYQPTHVAKIVRGAQWREKVEWIRTTAQDSHYTPAYVSRAMQKRDWRVKLAA